LQPNFETANTKDLDWSLCCFMECAWFSFSSKS